MAKALGDVPVTGCVAWSPVFRNLLPPDDDCPRRLLGRDAGGLRDSELNAWALALPFWCACFNV